MIKGATYSLQEENGRSHGYFRLVARLADDLLRDGTGVRTLRETVRQASLRPGLLGHFPVGRVAALCRKLDRILSPYTAQTIGRPIGLCARGLFDPVLGTTRRQLYLYMLEIELTNRLYRQAFMGAPWRMALLAHCLRDHQPACSSVPGEAEEECRRCRPDCVVNHAGELLGRWGIHPFISSTMDHENLFGGLKSRRPGMAVLGVACVPELTMGMRLVESLGIPVVGIPLDANRCPRWSGETLPTALNLQEVARLVGES